jgi:CubicO group peptidase (beta-lactamase class C family)
LRNRVLLPLGMNGSVIEPVTGLPGGFKADGVTELPYWHMTFSAFGALNASLADMSKLLEMLLHQGRLDGAQVFTEQSISTLFGPGTSLGARHGLEVGYGTGMYSWIRGGQQFWGHGGDADGYLSRYGLLPKSGRAYLLVINTDRPALLQRLRRRLEDSLVTDLDSERPPAILKSEDLEHYTGSYYPSAARFNISGWQSGQARRATITKVDGGLEFKRGNRTTLLLPVGPGQFRRLQDPVVTVVFAQGPKGPLFLQGELGNYVNASECPGFIPNCHQ